MCLFIGASYASAARYLMDNRKVIDIGLRVIKRCGMYAKEYKNWISSKNAVPLIVDDRLLQGILGQRNCTCQSDCCPGLATWLQNDRHGR
jgi:hypothetical protein